MMGLTIRDAAPGDGATIFHFIQQLADYEKLAHEVVATAKSIELLLGRSPPRAHAILAEYDGHPVGMALYFYNFSTFLGKHGLYIEDLYIDPEKRGLGIGRALLTHLAAHAVAQGFGRLEWWVLDWNDPAIRFYRSLGARAMEEWTTFRLEGDALQALAAQNSRPIPSIDIAAPAEGVVVGSALTPATA